MKEEKGEQDLKHKDIGSDLDRDGKIFKSSVVKSDIEGHIIEANFHDVNF